MSFVHRSSLLACSLLCVIAPAHGQTARQSSGNSAQAMLQLQQLAAERTQLQADNARLKQELDALRKERDALKSGDSDAARRARAAQAELARSAAQRDEATRELEQQRARLQELVQKSREIVDTLRGVERERAALQQTATERERGLALCADRNLELFRMNGELLTRLERGGSLGRLEPFTQISRARMENLIEDYRYRAEEQKVPSPTEAAEAAKPPSN